MTTALSLSSSLMVLLSFIGSMGGCSSEHDAPRASAPSVVKEEERASATAAGAAAGRALAENILANEAARLEAGDGSSEASPSTTKREPAADADGFVEIYWVQMIPADELETMKEAPLVIHTGSMRMRQYGKYTVVPVVLDRKIKLPGYVVPMDFDDKGLMTGFFFVPYFGACLHVPPPPPNQLVYATLAKAIRPPDIWEPFWLLGKLSAEETHSGVAGSAYKMHRALLKPYEG